MAPTRDGSDDRTQAFSSVQGRNSFFVVTNVIVTKNQKQGKCPEVLCPHSLDLMVLEGSDFTRPLLFQVPNKDKLCRTDRDCERGAWDEQGHGTGAASHQNILLPW